ncbi:MAG: fused MFS/spermidine synthase [Myxococcota bacterium]
MALRLSTARFGWLLPCFFLSGFAALIYQVVWTRQFAAVFGAAPTAVAAVLAAYMGGLSLGAALAGRWVDRVRRPLFAYALLEGGIALSALAVPAALEGSAALQVWLFGGLPELSAETGAAVTAFQLAAAFVVLGVPTAFMGMTLPLLARQGVREEEQITSRVGALYAFNTVGGVCGVLAAGFLLLPELGLGRSVWVAVSANVLAGLAALALARREQGEEPGALREALPEVAAPAERWPRRAWILPLVGLAGIASFGYEVLWSRLVGQLLGGGIAGFTIMLASFLTGIGLGAALAARVRGGPDRALRVFATAQSGVVLCSLLAFSALGALPAFLHGLGWQGVPALSGALAAGLLLPSSLCIGASFPLAVRALAQSAEQAGAASARVFAWNTLGSILGAIAAGFFLLPALGHAGFATGLMGLNLLVAVGALWACSGARGPALGLAGLALLALIASPPRAPWGLLRTSGLTGESARGRIEYYGLGRAAGVLVSAGPRGWRLYADGLPESQVMAPGTRPGGNPLAQWAATLPVLARPEARRMLVVGLGGGVILESVPASIERIDVLEIEPEILEANRVIAPQRSSDPLADPRLRVVLGDARGALSRSRARYDAIVSQPSHPWTEGSGPLFTREFFALLRAHMTPGGVLCQWMAARFLDEALLQGMLATLLEVFPHVRVYHPVPGGLLFLASESPLRVEEGAARALGASPQGFGALGIHRPEDVRAAWLLDESGSRALAEGGVVNRDDHNPLQMRSGRVARAGGSRPLEALGDYDPLVPHAPGSSRLRVVEVLLARGFLFRAQRVAEAGEEGAEQSAGRAMVAAAQGQSRRARVEAEQALQSTSIDSEVREVLLPIRAAAMIHEADRPESLTEDLSDPSAALLEAWSAEAMGDIVGLRALESRLAQVRPGGALYPGALRMRIAWRLQDPTPEEARDALRLADSLVASAGTPGDWVLRARAVAASSDAAATESALFEAAAEVRGVDVPAPVVRGALGVLSELPEEPGSARRRDRLKASLHRLLR